MNDEVFLMLLKYILLFFHFQNFKHVLKYIHLVQDNFLMIYKKIKEIYVKRLQDYK